MDWKTSNHMDGSEIRGGIGLQYFAENDTGADMDGFNGDDFLAALEGNDGLEDQQTAAEGEEETVQDGAEDQRTGEQQEEPEEQPPEGGEVPPETVEQPVQTVPLVYNGQQILLPADAVQALTGALGANPVELLQKGMNYDRKAEREMRVLDLYAEAAGMNRQQYLEQLEGARNEQLLSAEMEQCRAEFPDTPDAALKAIAEGRMASRRAAEAHAARGKRGTGKRRSRFIACAALADRTGHFPCGQCAGDGGKCDSGRRSGGRLNHDGWPGGRPALV